MIPLLSPYLADGGRFLFMMGPGAREGAPGGLPGTVTRRERLHLPRGMGEREIVDASLYPPEVRWPRGQEAP